MSEAPTIVGMHGEYKVPGGKLVVVDTDVEEDRLARVSVSGDFFLDPDDALTRITASLEGAPASSSAKDLAALVEGGLHARSQILRARRGWGPFEGRGDPGERVVGVEEEVAGHAHAREAILLHVGVDDDEFSSGDFVLSMHAHDCRRSAHAQSGRTRTPPLSADAASMP